MTLQDNGQYTITLDELLDETEFTNEDFTELYGEGLERGLINASNKVYNIMFSAAPNVYRKNNATYLNYLIQNSTTLQGAIKLAIIEYISGALYSGMDLRAYENDKQQYSNFVIDILKENELWVRAKFEYNDSDIE
jgi:hypothetical protein